ncbi:FAD/NAD(P)-binding protein [Algoriphagus aquimarinus]|uniref:FAD-NAD(P)-binding n=1 Tax=Algoriphagus aquimarinus TaxID=237018 RepID=A0A1I0XME6_9BACT|nr:FAD/NAD(P)-binding protein [Algoriphagus aquimarinus]SFB02132.1 FAD-NAD(P)-binding [Algoriphagus aquimarinus]
MYNNQDVYKIALVGLGPKGLYGLERILANLNLLEDPISIEIHLFNKTGSFGAGGIYDTNQPDFLLMNYVNGYINMWPEAKPDPIVSDPLTFVEWLELHQDEFPHAGAGTFASRATVGRYLADGFDQLIQACPDHISIYKHIGEVIDLQKDLDDYSIIFRNADFTEIEISGINKLLIATGHPCVNDVDKVSKNNHIDFIYPVDSKFSSIQSQDSIAIRGMGLTFVDAILGLTEGRKGSFEVLNNGDLRYLASGLEPAVIFPFSKSGLLMIPRGNTLEIPPYEPVFFTKQALNDLETSVGKFDFVKQLFPLIEQEYMFVYYSRLFSEAGWNLKFDNDFSIIHKQIDRFHVEFPLYQPFDLESFLRKPFTSTGLNYSSLEYLCISIEEAERGENVSALAAAAGLWRHLSELFNEVYKFGGLTPASQKVFIENYAGHFNRISYGPPIQNMKKVEAIAKAGFIDFTFAQNSELVENERLELTNSTLNMSATVDYLVDARIPKVQLQKCTGEFYGNLLARNMVMPYVNRMDSQPDYFQGCVAIDEKGNPVEANGLSNRSITFTGTPTEGLTYDNDTLSRKRNDFVSGWACQIANEIKSIPKQKCSSVITAS